MGRVSSAGTSLVESQEAKEDALDEDIDAKDSQTSPNNIKTAGPERADSKVSNVYLDKELTPAQVAHEMRRELVNILQENLIINSSQLTQRRQLARVLNRYFHGYKSSISTKLFIESLELHYEGIDSRSKRVLTDGLTDLLSECG